MTTLFATHRRSFTLMELLVIMAIFAILASTILYAVSGAELQARYGKTKELIARLNTIVMSRWNGYSTRRVPVNTIGQDTKTASKTRFDALHELMRVELPDRFRDITADPAMVARPACSIAYKNFLSSRGGASEAFQGAECLYMIATLGAEEGGARDSFRESDIGDYDNDGLPEFWDAWGKPISFLRWAPGFKSEMQTLDATADPDPFDPRKIYSGYKLIPLIFSCGPDGDYELHTSSDPSPINPFADKTIGAYEDVNGDGRDGSTDNLHNHFIVID